MSLLIHGTLGLLVGLLVFFVPAILAGMLPDSVRFGVANWYWRLAASSYRRMRLTINPHGDAKMHAASWDHEKQGDKISTGEEQWYHDSTKAMTRLKKFPLGLSFTKYSETIQPSDVTVGKEIYGLVDEKKHRRTLLTDGGDGEQRRVEAMTAHANIEPGTHLVEVRDISPRLVESWKPNDPEKAEEDIKNSQQGFKSRNALEMISILIAAGSGAGLAWLMWSNTSGSSAVTVPVQLANAAMMGVPI